MVMKSFSFGSAAAAFATFFLFAGVDAAEAARCPLGQIYRPSRGICISKEKAIEAGIYHGSHMAHVATRPERHAKHPALALAEIEKRAPAAARSRADAREEDALAYATESKEQPQRARLPMQASAVATPIEPKRVKLVPVVYHRPEPSPFGSLVALEPMLP